jgi:hypothetical protein
MAKNNVEIENMKEQLANELVPVFQTLQNEALTFADMVKRAFGLDAEFKMLKRIADQAEAAFNAQKNLARELISIHGSAKKAEEETIKRITAQREELSVLNLTRANGITLNEKQRERQQQLTIAVENNAKALEWLRSGFKGMDETPGAIEAITKKIATQKELIEAAAEKDLPALNLQLQLMEERLSKLQNIGKIQLPTGKSDQTARVSGEGDYSLGVTKGSGRDPVGEIIKLNEANKELNETLTASDMIAINFTESFVDGLFDVIANADNASEAIREMIKSMITDISKLLIKMAIMNALFPTSGFAAGIFSRIGGNASGTNNFRGGLTMVGEYGPELVSLPGGSSIYSASKTAGMMGGQELFSRVRGTDIIMTSDRTRSNRQR